MGFAADAVSTPTTSLTPAFPFFTDAQPQQQLVKPEQQHSYPTSNSSSHCEEDDNTDDTID